jgi:hypothetical protein
MDLIELIITVCAIAAPMNCHEAHLQFTWRGSLQQCAMGAQPYIAQWIGEHPKWNAVRWRCEYPHSDDRADARSAQ